MATVASVPFGSSGAAKGWSSKTRFPTVTPIHALRADVELALLFVLNDWESVAGVKSNHAAQVEAVANGIHQRALGRVARQQRRREERARGAKSNLKRTKVPLANRGWPMITARPSKGSAGGFHTRTTTVPGDRLDPEPCIVTVGAAEEWALLRGTLPGYNVSKADVVKTYRALCRMGERPDGQRMLVVLNLLYGEPRLMFRCPAPAPKKLDEAEDFEPPGGTPICSSLRDRFGDLAPIVHLTPTARKLAQRRSDDRLEHASEKTAAPSRSEVDFAVSTGSKERRTALRDAIHHESGQLRIRALNALRAAMEVGS